MEPNGDPSYGSLPADEERPLPDTKPSKPFKTNRRRLNALALLPSLVLPWLQFVVVCMVLTFGFRIGAIFVFAALLGVLLLFLVATRARTRSTKAVSYAAAFTAATALLGFVAGLVVGNQNRKIMRPYDTIVEMALYLDVDPLGPDDGRKFMDAGRVFFKPGARPDTSRSVGFKSRDTYCVAPVGSGPARSYDFWAVGVNCCPDGEFNCGDVHDPLADAGLRLLDDGPRPYFRLAVQEAEAAFGIRAQHPIFLHWLRDPNKEVAAYPKKAYQRFTIAVWCSLGLQAFLVAVLAVTLVRVGA